MTFEETLRAPLNTKWVEKEERNKNRTMNISNKLAFGVGIPLIAALSLFTRYMIKDIQTQEQQMHQSRPVEIQEQYQTAPITNFPEVYLI